MIQLSGRPFNYSNIWHAGSVERKTVQTMIEDPLVHSYGTIDELRFELNLRKNIIASARAMNESDMDFEIFSTSRCNPKYWIVTETGGFRLRDDVLLHQKQ